MLLTVNAIDLGVLFQTEVLPDGISTSKSANWEGTSIMNRSAPMIAYGDSSAQTISLTFKLYATFGDTAAEVVNPCKSLTSLVEPVKPGIQPPSRCLITCGGYFKDFLCVCDNVDVTYSTESIWDVRAGDYALPMTAEVAMSFTEIDPYPRKASDWLVGGFLYKPWGGISP